MKAQYIGRRTTLKAQTGYCNLVYGGVYEITVRKRKSGRVRVTVESDEIGQSEPIVYAGPGYSGKAALPSYEDHWREMP